MTPEEINRAISESLGKRYHKPTHEEIASGSYYQYEPDYFNDLNAIREARLAILTTPELKVKFLNTLRTLLLLPGAHLISDYDLLNAGPDKQSEVLVRTINKWVEEKKGEG